MNDLATQTNFGPRRTSVLWVAVILVGLSLLIRALRWQSDSESTLGKSLWACRVTSLPEADRELAEFLLLLPIGALVCALFRNVVGLPTYGTFTPAILALAFRDSQSLWGVPIILAVLFFGWLIRRSLVNFYLLQVPRAAVLLTFVCLILLGVIFVSHQIGTPASRYFRLFPLVILTGMIERFWLMEEEEGMRSSFWTLFHTVALAGAIALLISWETLRRQFLEGPEAIGVVLAGQFLLGRYTGYRLTELYRFRSLA